MATQQNQVTVWGECFNPDAPDNPTPGSISVSEIGQDVIINGSKVPSGKPIDTPLAAYFINNFYNHYKIYTDEHNEKYDTHVKTKNFDGLNELYKKSKTIHDHVVNITYGMTFDKDVLLKVLSQPECEGIRFYLCARAIDPNKPEQLHLSLVTIGVDKDGFDLNFLQGLTPLDNTCPSLTCEYATPPPPTGIAPNTDKNSAANIGQQYGLLKLARNKQASNKPGGRGIVIPSESSVAQKR